MKTCKKCGISKPMTTEFFYRHKASKSGLTPRCKSCVDIDNKEVAERAIALNPDKIRQQARIRSARWYHKNIEESRARAREYARRARSDESKRELINTKKRANGAKVTPEEFNLLLDAQKGVCAFCQTSEPAIYSQGKSGGWNLDHCHKTGAVRFILCSPCNRGLAAFRENPETMRRAADLMEQCHGK